MILNGAISNGLLQAVVPDGLRGRIMAAYGLVVVGLAQVVGAFARGVVADVLGVATAIGIAARLMLAYGCTGVLPTAGTSARWRSVGVRDLSLL